MSSSASTSNASAAARVVRQPHSSVGINNSLGRDPSPLPSRPTPLATRTNSRRRTSTSSDDGAMLVGRSGRMEAKGVSGEGVEGARKRSAGIATASVDTMDTGVGYKGTPGMRLRNTRPSLNSTSISSRSISSTRSSSATRSVSGPSLRSRILTVGGGKVPVGPKSNVSGVGLSQAVAEGVVSLEEGIKAGDVLVRVNQQGGGAGGDEREREREQTEATEDCASPPTEDTPGVPQPVDVNISKSSSLASLPSPYPSPFTRTHSNLSVQHSFTPRSPTSHSRDRSKPPKLDVQRPSLHTYTSFDETFNVRPPPSPPASPKIEGRGWWRV